MFHVLSPLRLKSGHFLNFFTSEGELSLGQSNPQLITSDFAAARNAAEAVRAGEKGERHPYSWRRLKRHRRPYEVVRSLLLFLFSFGCFSISVEEARRSKRLIIKEWQTSKRYRKRALKIGERHTKSNTSYAFSGSS